MKNKNSYNFLSFTGQHKCVLNDSNVSEGAGLIVSSTGEYDNMNYEKPREKLDEGVINLNDLIKQNSIKRIANTDEIANVIIFKDE